MGGYQSTATTVAEKKTVLWKGSYDTKGCLPGCIEKCRLEGHDPYHKLALQNAVFLRNAVMLRRAIRHGRPGDHPLLANNDVMWTILRLLLECSVQERLERSVTLSKPWTVKCYEPLNGFYEVRAPEGNIYRNRVSHFMTIWNGGRRYSISNYFWFDDVYDSTECLCPPRLEYLRQYKAATESEERSRRMKILLLGEPF